MAQGKRETNGEEDQDRCSRIGFIRAHRKVEVRPCNLGDPHGTR